ncbi:EFG1 (YGR271C-A) [Zygosaccharomyces parabailii]|nr:EFG1 (YGR271C-A) [Zygosaccharomyces parabailii]SJM84051.1 related to rRNA-processing protein EFG1 [Zygosaccharomyces bailii]
MPPKSHRSPMGQFPAVGSNKIKKRIRDIERLLARKRDSLPDTVIIEKERSLQALRHELDQAQLKQKVRKNAKKYHMVRFFERKKAMRKYKNALKNDADPEELYKRKVDLCYVVNFPKSEKYIALYPNQENDSLSTRERREAFRDTVAKQLQSGSLPVPLEDILKGKKLSEDGNGVTLENESLAELHEEPSQGRGEVEEVDEFFESV